MAPLKALSTLAVAASVFVRAQGAGQQWDRRDHSTGLSSTGTVNPLSTLSPTPFIIGAYPTPDVPPPGAGKGSPLVALNLLTNTGEKNKTAPLLYGWMFEDIDHSGDGGIYAELIQNRAFQGSSAQLGTIPGVPGTSIIASENPLIPFGPTIKSWRGIGDVRMALDIIHPLSEALPTVMQLDILEAATGEAGVLNEGWFGMDVSPQQYNASFFILADPRNQVQPASIDVSLRSNLTGEVWTTATIPITHNITDFSYSHLSTIINNNVTAPNSNNSFAITFNNVTELQGTTFYLGLVSLFPETYKNRPNGLRKDLAEHFKALNPRFLRFPGGNNIEGYSPMQRWKWWQTVGPLKDRKGRIGDWDYYNTNGLGLLEMLEWCEDMDMVPVVAVYAGYSLALSGYTGASYPEDQMDEVLQEALGMLEYCTGDVNTTHGAMRAKHGHPEPFKIDYVEIGNEDWFSLTYPYRFDYLYKGLHAKYPHINYISSTFNENLAYNISLPKGVTWDAHFYLEPPGFLTLFNEWDNWQEITGNEGVPIFAGEYSVYNFSSDPPPVVLYPRLINALSESVYLLGAERNPNVVKMSSYAPSIRSQDNPNQSPHLITFTADPKKDVLSISYYAQQLLNAYRGSESITVHNSAGDFNPLWWAASMDEAAGVVYLKVINTGESEQQLSVNLECAIKGVNGTIITGDDPMAYNWFGNATGIVPEPLTLDYQGGPHFNWSVPSYSLSVIQFDI